jgi:hypothetical protein
MVPVLQKAGMRASPRRGTVILQRMDLMYVSAVRITFLLKYTAFTAAFDCS